MLLEYITPMKQKKIIITWSGQVEQNREKVSLDVIHVSVI